MSLQTRSGDWKSVSTTAEPTSSDVHNQVYTALLSELKLSDLHKQDLRGRGLTDDEIIKRTYRTLPLRGRSRIARELHERFGDRVRSVPGFYEKRGGSGSYLTLAGSVGLLVPVRDVEGRIVALKVRSDGDGRFSKYSYVSSTKHDGPGPGSPVHIPLGVTPQSQAIRVTEGELKADITTALGDIPTISVPGVSNWLPAMEVLRTLEATTVLLAFDADARTNPKVAGPLLEFAEALVTGGFDVELERWSIEAGKGIDDLLAAGGTPEVLVGDEAMQAVREIADAAGVKKSDKDSSHGSKKSQATQLVELATTAHIELFHTPGVDGDGFATIPVGDHRETWRIRSKTFNRWLAHRYFRETQRAPSSQALQEALDALDGRAQFAAPAIEVACRIAEHGDSIYIDLANDAWEVVHVTESGWSIVTTAPVRFIRPRGLQRLPTPTRGGSVDDLRQFLNIENDADWVLILSWLVAALRPRGPYPILALNGEQGSAKSTACRILRSLVDPNLAALRSAPKDPRDLMIAATNAWCVSFDNFSEIKDWLSDALCRLSTGGGFGTRELYSDGEEKLFDAKRPILLNGITEVATRPDLLDRTIPITLPVIPDSKRRTESELWAAFEDARPQILGSLLNAVVTAMQRLPEVRLSALPRMADFAEWATAAEPAFGCEPGAFMAAYGESQADATTTAIEASSIAEPLQELMDDRSEWNGSATPLLAELEKFASDRTVRQQAWPKAANALSGKLRQLAPSLRKIGIDIEFDQELDANRRKVIHIRKVPQNIVQTGPTVQVGANCESGSSDDRSDRPASSGAEPVNYGETAGLDGPNDPDDVFPDHSDLVNAQTTSEAIIHRDADCRSTDWWEHRFGAFYCVKCSPCTDEQMLVREGNGPPRQ